VRTKEKLVRCTFSKDYEQPWDCKEKATGKFEITDAAEKRMKLYRSDKAWQSSKRTGREKGRRG